MIKKKEIVVNENSNLFHAISITHEVHAHSFFTYFLEPPFMNNLKIAAFKNVYNRAKNLPCLRKSKIYAA